MIIDGQAAFRSLLSHHVTTHWPKAIVSEYDPIVAGDLPDEFSGAGNDIILLGDELGNEFSRKKGLQTLRQFRKTPGFPPVVYFSKGDENEDKAEATMGAYSGTDEEPMSDHGAAIGM